MRDVEIRKVYLAISILNIEILDLYRKKANIEILRYTTNRAGLCQKQKVSPKQDIINSAIHAKRSKALAEKKSIAKMQFFHICDTKPGFQGPDPLAQAATDPELLNLTNLSKPDKRTVPPVRFQAATDPELLNLTNLSKPDKRTVPLSGS